MFNRVIQVINYFKLVKLRDFIDRSFSDINRQIYQGDNEKLSLLNSDIIRVDENSHRLYVHSNIGNLYIIKQYKDKLFFTIYIGTIEHILLDSRLINNIGIVSSILNCFNEAIDLGTITLQSNTVSDLGLYYTTTARWGELKDLPSITAFIKDINVQVEKASIQVMDHVKMLKDFNSLNEEFNLEESDDDEFNDYADFR